VDELLLESWDRQARIIQSLADLVDEKIRSVKPSEDGWPLDAQLAHVHQTRRWWLKSTDAKYLEGYGRAVLEDGETPIADLGEIKGLLVQSAAAVRTATLEGLKAGGKFGPYDHAIFFLQHMVWHEGYHAGLILLALRNAGQDPSDEWCEKHIWELWRGPEEW